MKEQAQYSWGEEPITDTITTKLLKGMSHRDLPIAECKFVLYKHSRETEMTGEHALPAESSKKYLTILPEPRVKPDVTVFV